MLTILVEDNGRVQQSADAARLETLLADPSRPFWADLEAPSPEEFALLSGRFKFHHLAVEDAGKPHQRPKVDEFDGFIYLVADEVTADLSDTDPKQRGAEDDPEDVTIRQLSLFLGPHYLVTVHMTPVETLRGLRDQCAQKHQTLGRGADYLLYALLDRIVDGYFPVLDAFDDALDDLEDRVVGRPDPSVLERLFKMKRDVTRLRKLVGPLRERCLRVGGFAS